MDGNGRWANERGLSRTEGHKAGVENVKRIVRAVGAMGIKHVTLYAFSCENWNRPKEEVGALMHLLELYLRTQTRDLHKEKIRLRVIGRMEELPAPVLRVLKKTIDATAAYDHWTLTLALNYGARTEITDAFQSCLSAVQNGTLSPEKLDYSEIARHLYTKDLPDPDLIIRTSGEQRISNFLLLQGAYAELFFSPKYWPDFSPEDLQDAITSYYSRERRFGKTSDQIRCKPSSD
jgi:undecaprenyl diphosphate synthase